jgi:transposase
VSQLCRKKGIFSHHIKQWTENFTQGQITNMNSNNGNENKQLKAENKALKKEINRKDKALAETAALLVLQKKVQEIWGSNEVNLQ